MRAPPTFILFFLAVVAISPFSTAVDAKRQQLRFDERRGKDLRQLKGSSSGSYKGEAAAASSYDPDDQRVAFLMYLKPGYAAEYKKRHDEIWPELVTLLENSGVYDYSIFLDEATNILFAFQRVKGGASSQDLGQLEIVQKWWAYMGDIMETNPDNSPITKPIPEVFRMD